MRKQSELRDKYLQGRMGKAEERAASVGRSAFRLIRTIALGTVAVVFAILWLGDQYGLDREMMLSYLTSSALFVGALMLIASAGAGLLLLLKWLKKLSER